MSEFEYRKDVPRDVRNTVTEYVQGSRPLYREWASSLYETILMPQLGKLGNILDKNKVIDAIVDIFVDIYGDTLGNALDKLQDPNPQKKDTLFNYNGIISLRILDIFTSQGLGLKVYGVRDFGIPNFLKSLWEPYHTNFFKSVLDLDGYDIDDFNSANMDSEEIFSFIESAISERLNPFEIDPISGQSFFEWLLNIKWRFKSKEDREWDESIILEMLRTEDYFPFINWENINKTLIKTINLWDLDKSLEGWSNEFILEILKILDIRNLPNPLKNTLLYTIAGINNDEFRNQLWDEIVRLDPNFDFNVTRKLKYGDRVDDINIMSEYRIYSNPTLVKELIQRGTDPMYQNESEYRPLDYQNWMDGNKFKQILEGLGYKI